MLADVAATRRTTYLRAALVKRAHGVGGEVRAEPLGEDPSRFHAGLRLIREDSEALLTVESVRTLGDGDVLLTFAEMPTRESTLDLSGVYLCVERGQARRLGKDEWFVGDLIGLRALTVAGDELGTVSDIEVCPAHDIVVVGEGALARRFPMVKAFVAGVDIDAGTITLTPWEEI